MGQEDDPALVDPVTSDRAKTSILREIHNENKEKTLINCSTIVLQNLVHYGVWVGLGLEHERQSSHFTYRAGTG